MYTLLTFTVLRSLRFSTLHTERTRVKATSSYGNHIHSHCFMIELDILLFTVIIIVVILIAVVVILLYSMLSLLYPDSLLLIIFFLHSFFIFPFIGIKPIS